MATTLLPAIDVSTLGHRRGLPIDLARATALRWQSAGSSWIHLVDLDAASGRRSVDEELAADLGALIDELDLAVELAGGIHDAAALDRALATGCDRVVLAATALDDLAWCGRAISEHGDRIAVGLDVRSTGRPGSYEIAPRGARPGRPVGVLDLWDVVDRLDAAGCARYVVTDVTTDGALGGPNLPLLRSIGDRTAAAIVASGGIASLDDLVAVGSLPSVDGVIVGAALHAGRFDVRQALDTLAG